MPISILHTNDMHGCLTPERAARLARVRQECDLYFDTGDAIKTGNLGIPWQTEAVWDELAKLRCTASVLGNRETHVLEAAFRAKLAGAGHPLRCGNLRRKDGARPLPGTLELAVRGVRVGVLAVMVPMVTERMKTQAASAYLWDDPVATAEDLAADLRPRVDLLIALTHIGYRMDLALAEAVPSLDIILGGHSHHALEEPVIVGHTAVCQGGSHCKFIGVYEWANGRLSGGLRPFP